MNKKLLWIIAILSLCQQPIHSQETNKTARELAKRAQGIARNLDIGSIKRFPLSVSNDPLTPPITYVVVRKKSMPNAERLITHLLDAFSVDHKSWENSEWHGNPYDKMTTQELGQIVILTSLQMNTEEHYTADWNKLLEGQFAVMASFGDDASVMGKTGTVCLVEIPEPSPETTVVVRNSDDAKMFRELFRGIMPSRVHVYTLSEQQESARNLPDNVKIQHSLNLYVSKLTAVDEKERYRYLAVIERDVVDGSPQDLPAYWTVR